VGKPWEEETHYKNAITLSFSSGGSQSQSIDQSIDQSINQSINTTQDNRATILPIFA